MTVIINCREKQILKIRNALFGFFHDAMMKIVEENELELNSSIQELLHEMDQNVYGGGAIYADITHLKNKNDALVFADLVKQAIEKEQKSEYPFREDVEKLLWDFHQAIVDYAMQLKE